MKTNKNMPKKVIIDGRLLDLNRNTGISRYTEFIYEYYVKRKYEVFLILNERSNILPGCSPIYTDLKPYNIVDFYKYPNFIDKLSFDILHIPFYSGLYRRAKNSKGRIVITVHDLMYNLVKDFFGKNRIINYFKRTYFNHIVSKTLKTSDAIISVSETTQKDLQRLFKVNSIVIPEHSKISKNSDNSVLNTFGLVPKGFYFYCGNNRRHKNINFIKKVFNEDFLEYPLVLSGKDHEGGENIIATGIISDEALKSLYINAKGFIFPSCYEGFGLPILESLYCNTPIICSDIPAFREFHSNNIEFFKINDKESFINALKITNNKNFKSDETLLCHYSKENIYNLFDLLLNKLCNCPIGLVN